MLLLRALLAFLVLPGVVAGAIPFWLAAGTPVARETWPLAAGVMTLGGGLLLWCVRDFLVAGRGTLAPWDPPRRLVVVGLYRHVRNPMYLAVLTLLLGWALLFQTRVQVGYFFLLVVLFHLRVRFHEEPWLRTQFGVAWATYSAAVPRWFPRLPPPRLGTPSPPRTCHVLRDVLL